MILRHLYTFIYALLLSAFSVAGAYAQQAFETVQTFPAGEAHQGVAVDSEYFYAIASRSIGKYDKRTGSKTDSWEEKTGGPILHLDSGVIVNGKLYAAHSNFPQIPMTSSVEVWDTENLEHIDSYSFGIGRGSFTWLDRHEGYWWGVFAHYKRFEDQIHKDNRWTTLVQFNDRWEPLESWVFPEKVLKRFGTMSNSGGSWGPGGMLYVSGHDLSELYVLQLPESGSVLELMDIIKINNEGQGIAWDRSRTGNIIYTIKRSSREVVVSTFKRSGE